jgi:putative membrane protein
MSRTANWLLWFGVLLFISILASQGLPAIASTLARAGWGLLPVAAYHLLPLILDAVAICVLFQAGITRGAVRDAVLARWVGESANSLMPAGQIGGPVLMARHLAQRGVRLSEAAATITVSTTLQTFAQIAFALTGVLLLTEQTGHIAQQTLRISVFVASCFLAVQVGGFYLIQRRGLFSKLMRTATRFSGKRDWSQFLREAHAIDLAVQDTYGRGGRVSASFFLSLAGWIVGTGEVYLITWLLRAPLGWGDSLVLESLGQAVRGAGFAIPGALGVQEGGYLLLAPLVGLPRDAALALSLAKRARELILGLPGLLYLHLTTRGSSRAAPRLE